MAFGDLMGMMKQAKELQARMEAMQQEVAAMEVDGSSGGGLVKVTMNGKGEMRKLSIDPSLMKPEEAEIVEDLIVTACNDARAKAEAALAEKMRAMTGGLQLPPGMKLPF
jgi:DNA-binding YbaB/EbfC family protein